MKKINLKLLILTSILTLLPMSVGIFFWEKLPGTLPSHFGLDGRADGFSSKQEVVFLIPLLMLGLHIFAIVVTSLDPKASRVNSKMRHMIYWLVPVINGLVTLSIYGTALGLISNSYRFDFYGNALSDRRQLFTKDQAKLYGWYSLALDIR